MARSAATRQSQSRVGDCFATLAMTYEARHPFMGRAENMPVRNDSVIPAKAVMGLGPPKGTIMFGWLVETQNLASLQDRRPWGWPMARLPIFREGRNPDTVRIAVVPQTQAHCISKVGWTPASAGVTDLCRERPPRQFPAVRSFCPVGGYSPLRIRITSSASFGRWLREESAGNPE